MPKAENKPLCKLCKERHWLREPHGKVTEDESKVTKLDAGKVTENTGKVTREVVKLLDTSKVTEDSGKVTWGESRQKAWEERNKESVRQRRKEYMKRYRVKSVSNPVVIEPRIPGLIMEGNKIMGADPSYRKEEFAQPGTPNLGVYTSVSPDGRMRKGIIEDRKGRRHEVELDTDGQPIWFTMSRVEW